MVLIAKSCSVSQNPGELLWSSYRRSLQKRPLLTKSLTSLVGFAVGDVVAQVSSGARWSLIGPNKYDIGRTLRISAFGAFVNGPMSHGWFKLLDKNVLPNMPKSPAAVVTKMMLDQIVMAPLGTCVFYLSLKTMEGCPDKTLAEVREKLVPTLVASYRLWPAAHLVNFALIPSNMRVLYTNLVAVGWAVVLSKLANDRVGTAEPPEVVHA